MLKLYVIEKDVKLIYVLSQLKIVWTDLIKTGRNFVGDLLELGHKEAVHVVRVRVVSLRQVEARVEPSFPVALR